MRTASTPTRMLQEYVVDAKRAYDEMIARYRPKKLPERLYNAGDSARLLATHLGVDAIAFSKLSITITPAGKAIVSALIGGSTSGANSMIGIVDGQTADLEAVQIALAIVTPGEKSPDEIGRLRRDSRSRQHQASARRRPVGAYRGRGQRRRSARRGRIADQRIAGLAAVWSSWR